MSAGYIYKGVMPMITIIHHIVQHVHDLQRTTRMYLELGLPVIPLSSTNAFVLAPNGGLLLQHSPSTQPASTEVHAPGWTHLCIQVPTISRAVTTCRNHTMIMQSAPVDLRTGHLYVYGRDSDKTLIEIEEVPYTPFSYPIWLGHMACVSEDVARLAHFYASLIGGEVVNPGVIGPNPAYDQVIGFNQARLHPVWIKRLNLTIELWQFVNPPSPIRTQPVADALGYTSVAYVSDNLVEDAQRCVALGAQILSTTANQVALRDCDGNRMDLYTSDHPLIRATGPCYHPEVLAENAKHWRPRP